MMKIKIHVIKTLKYLVIIILLQACMNTKNEKEFSNSLITQVFENNIRSFSESKMPTYKEFMSNKSKSIDTNLINTDIRSVVIYVDTASIKFPGIELEKLKLPQSYYFLLNKNYNTLSLFQKDNIVNELNKNFKIVYVDEVDYKEIFNQHGLNFGGFLQFSDFLINQSNSKSAIFLRNTISPLDSVEKNYTLRKGKRQVDYNKANWIFDVLIF